MVCYRSAATELFCILAWWTYTLSEIDEINYRRNRQIDFPVFQKLPTPRHSIGSW